MSGRAPVIVPDTVTGCGSFAPDGTTPLRDEGVPAVRLPCLADGPDVELDDLGRRPVLVGLWASWCAPYREEKPLLQQAYGSHGDRIAFLGVDTEDSRSAAVSFLTGVGITHADVVDTDGRLLTELGVPGLPVALAVDADGRIVDRQIGQMSAERLEELVTGLTASAPTP